MAPAVAKDRAGLAEGPGSATGSAVPAATWWSLVWSALMGLSFILGSSRAHLFGNLDVWAGRGLAVLGLVVSGVAAEACRRSVKRKVAASPGLAAAWPVKRLKWLTFGAWMVAPLASLFVWLAWGI
jgi:hypothetical protein